MALFDSIIGSAREKFGLSNEGSGGLIAALLGLIIDPRSGGFGGFIDKFRNAGLGPVVDSWISTGSNEPLTGDQVESALGSDAIDGIATRAGVDRKTASTALGGIIPNVVDTLTPEGNVPDDSSLLSRIGGFLSDWGGAIGGVVAGGVGAAAAMAGGAADKLGDGAGRTYDKSKEVMSGGIGAASNVAGAASGAVTNAYDGGSGGSSALRWILPLLLLGLFVFLGFLFCGRGAPTGTNGSVNANANRSNANLNSTRPVNANASVNASVNANSNANGAEDGAARTLSEMTLPNGTRLPAFPGGIEDQLVKFIQSDDYKNATNDSLKDKWFNFDDLNFVVGKAELTTESKRQLDNITAILKAFPDAKIKIGGYTDRTGNDTANKKLSDDRAKAVQAALQKAGVGAQVPEAEGYGEQFATVEESASDEARKVDRKTAIRLMK